MVGLIPGGKGQCTAGVRTLVVLPDGRPLLIRPLAPGDRPAIAALLARLSTESRAHRFQSAAVGITPATLDQVTAGHVLVAALGDQLVALGSYVARPDATQAELALVVADAEQGRGIGTALGARLAHDARRAGLREFQAEIAGSNRRVLRLLRGLGCGLTSTWAFGALTVSVELCPELASGRTTSSSGAA
jgi:GNAT superfamily N-acetyltransferase